MRSSADSVAMGRATSGYSGVSRKGGTLKGDLDGLLAADVSSLSPTERRRFDALVAAARHYIEIFPRVLEESREAVRRRRKWEAAKKKI